MKKPSENTTWEPVAGWYKGLVGDKGHYYHQHVIIPESLKILSLNKESHPKRRAQSQYDLSIFLFPTTVGF